MRVLQVPMFRDNYGHVLLPGDGSALAVDPAQPEPVLAAIEAAGASLTHVLCTHHHNDHVGGNRSLAARFPDLEIIGPAADQARIPALTRPATPGVPLHLGAVTATVLDVPCHTRGHIAYLFADKDGDVLFCGDTLFVGGCGRFFEGTPAQMHRALNHVFGELAGDTRVYCAHEYTVSNLRFALSVDPNNAALRHKLDWALERRAAGLSTVPSTLAEERTYNPFMRLHTDAIKQATGELAADRVMGTLRQMKNAF